MKSNSTTSGRIRSSESSRKTREGLLMPPRNFKVQIVNNLGTLDDEVSAMDGATPVSIQDLKKLKSKALKKDYRSDLKDITRYPKTHIADPNHMVVRMKKGGGDDVTFV